MLDKLFSCLLLVDVEDAGRGKERQGCYCHFNAWFSSDLFVPLQIEREKLHGCIDVGLSVMSVKKSSKCIDLDTEEHIYHLKVRLSPGAASHCRILLHREGIISYTTTGDTF